MPHMVKSRFEEAVEKLMAANVDAMFKLEPGNGIGHALHKGIRLGIQQVLDAHKKLNRTDDDGDGDL